MDKCPFCKDDLEKHTPELNICHACKKVFVVVDECENCKPDLTPYEDFIDGLST